MNEEMPSGLRTAHDTRPPPWPAGTVRNDSSSEKFISDGGDSSEEATRHPVEEIESLSQFSSTNLSDLTVPPRLSRCQTQDSEDRVGTEGAAWDRDDHQKGH